MTKEQAQSEVQLLTIDNIKRFPISRSLREDFYNMWQRFGSEAARTYMIPPVFNGQCPMPSLYFNV
jgi:hypothetical protein